jgi:hypothetical protein
MSADMPVSNAQARLILLDNPMGQGDELTPFVVVHRAGADGERQAGGASQTR